MSSATPLDRYAVFGNPIAHSRSPEIHRLFARQTGEQLQYDWEEVGEDRFEQRVAEFFAAGGCGLNITMPFKLRAFECAEELTPRARAAGAVNTLALRAGRLLGDTTDGAGLVADIRDLQGWPIAGRRLLILGAGGAVRGVLQPLLAEAPASLVIANRTPARAQQLVQLFGVEAEAAAVALSACGFTDLTGRQFDLVINATGASLAGDLPPLPDDLLAPGADCYDMTYGRESSPFLRWAEARGASHRADGLGMLVGQAAESFYLWRGKRPKVAPVLAVLRQTL